MTRVAHHFRRAGAAALAALLVAAPTHAFPGALNDGAKDAVKATRAVPDPRRKVGDVKLLARGNAVVVQTALSTTLLDRVTSEIRKKEEGNWPAGDPSREAYLAALERTREAIEKRDAASTDRHRRLLIEFAADDTNAAVFLGTFRFVNGESGAIEREVLETLELPRSYVLRNMRLILADSFDVPESEVNAIGPLGPAAASPDVSAPASKGVLANDSPVPKDAPSPPPKGAAN